MDFEIEFSRQIKGLWLFAEIREYLPTLKTKPA